MLPDLRVVLDEMLIARTVVLIADPELHRVPVDLRDEAHIDACSAALISEMSFACGPRSSSRCCIAFTRTLPVGFGLIFGDAAQHRQAEPHARRHREQHAFAVDQ